MQTNDSPTALDYAGPTTLRNSTAPWDWLLLLIFTALVILFLLPFVLFAWMVYGDWNLSPG